MKVPDKLSMLAFVRLVRSYVDDKKGYPIIVHCRYDVKLNSCIFSEQHCGDGLPADTATRTNRGSISISAEIL